MSRRIVERVGRSVFFTLALTVAPLITHLPTTSFVLESLLKNKADCSGMMNPTTPNHPFDAIAVPGAGIIKAPDGTAEPSADGKIRLTAAAIEYLNGKSLRIILLDGQVNPGYEGVSKRFLQQIGGQQKDGSWRISDSDILEDNVSINTATNMEELRKILEREGLGLPEIITNRYHGLRTGILACNHGIVAASKSAEDILIEQDPRWSPVIQEMYASPMMRAVELKEGAERLTLLWFPQSGVTTLLRRIN